MSDDCEKQFTSNGLAVLKSRYLRKGPDGQPNETIEEMFMRVAKHISRANCDPGPDGDSRHAHWTAVYYELLKSLKFLPNTPTFTGAGSPLGQLAACFVLPIDDDIGKDSKCGIFSTLRDGVLIQQSGGGVGFSFSRLRPRGDRVAKSNGIASGPVSFMRVYDAAFLAVEQGGNRRGANMGVLRVDHPDILEFITCKEGEGALTNFNISVAITDAFMEAVLHNTEYSLINPRTGLETRKMRARAVMDTIVSHAWLNGEPGVLFIDTANKRNPVPGLYRIETTNPCGTPITAMP